MPQKQQRQQSRQLLSSWKRGGKQQKRKKKKIGVISAMLRAIVVVLSITTVVGFFVAAVVQQQQQQQTIRKVLNNNGQQLFSLFDKHYRGKNNRVIVKSDKELGIDHLDNDDDTVTKQLSQNVTREDAMKGRESLLEILKNAGVTDIETKTLLKLPTWEQVTKLYGNDGPVVYGLETCEAFRKENTMNQKENNRDNRPFLAVSGMFNTGTNPLYKYLKANCMLPQDNTNDDNNERDGSGSGVQWQVPWGKHVPADRKWTHTVVDDGDDDLRGGGGAINKTRVLPVVLIRDPYFWMQSLCRNSYGARFQHTKEHCPAMIPNQHDLRFFGKQLSQQQQETNTVPVRIRFPALPEEKKHNTPHWEYQQWDSLVDLWNDWYRQYYEVTDYPRIMVRFEDLFFHAKELVTTICECGGGVLRYNSNNDTATTTARFTTQRQQQEQEVDFVYLVNSGKSGPGHNTKAGEDPTNLLSGMIKYGKDNKRFRGFTKDDLTFAYESLDQELMTTFRYEIPLPP